MAVVPFLSFASPHGHGAHAVRRRVLSLLSSRPFFHLCQFPCHSGLSSSFPVFTCPPHSSCSSPSFSYYPYSLSVSSVSLIHPDCATAAGFHVVFSCWYPYAAAAGYRAPVATASGWLTCCRSFFPFYASFDLSTLIFSLENRKVNGPRHILIITPYYFYTWQTVKQPPL